MSNLLERMKAYSRALRHHGDERTMQAAIVEEAADRIQYLEGVIRSQRDSNQSLAKLIEQLEAKLDAVKVVRDEVKDIDDTTWPELEFLSHHAEAKINSGWLLDELDRAIGEQSDE